MSDTPETDRIERRWRDYALLSFDDIFDLARRLERERDEVKADLEFRRGLFRVQEEQLNKVRDERDQYRGLLIRLHNDLFVHHGGQAVREFKELFREENYN